MCFEDEDHTLSARGFLHLPVEVRLRIYRHLFSINPASISLYTPAAYHPYETKDRTFFEKLAREYMRLSGPKDSKPYILLACKTTYAEAWDPFIQGAILHHGMPDVKSSFFWGATPAVEIRGELDMCLRSGSKRSNIILSPIKDVPKIQSLYDSRGLVHHDEYLAQLSHHFLKLKLLTVVGSWNSTVSGGEFIQVRHDMRHEVSEQNYQRKFTPDLLRKIELHQRQVKKERVRCGDQPNMNANNADINENTPQTQDSDTTAVDETKVGYTVKGINVRKIAENSIAGFRMREWPYLPENIRAAMDPEYKSPTTPPENVLMMSKTQRGFAIHVVTYINLIIKHNMELGSDKWVDWFVQLPEDPAMCLSLVQAENRRARAEGKVPFEDVLVQILQVRHDWDTGEIIDIHTKTMREVVRSGTNRGFVS